VTHRFHPLCGQDFEFVAHRQNWGEDRVHLHDGNGVLFSLPAGWTDAGAAVDRVPASAKVQELQLREVIDHMVVNRANARRTMLLCLVKVSFGFG
jgi:Family of unknown function (DUF5372)